MRMWMINPNLLCRKHLLGEHYELHKLAGAIEKGKSLKGYIRDGLVELHNINSRHDELIQEFERRGYNHNSPMDIKITEESGKVDVTKNIEELKRRCCECYILLQ